MATAALGSTVQQSSSSMAFQKPHDGAIARTRFCDCDCEYGFWCCELRSWLRGSRAATSGALGRSTDRPLSSLHPLRHADSLCISNDRRNTKTSELNICLSCGTKVTNNLSQAEGALLALRGAQESVLHGVRAMQHQDTRTRRLGNIVVCTVRLQVSPETTIQGKRKLDSPELLPALG